MHLQLRLAIESDQHGNSDHAAGMVIEPRTRPGLAPGIAGNKVLKLIIQRRQMLQRTVDVGVAQYFAPYRHPVLIALFIIHGVPPGKSSAAPK